MLSHGLKKSTYTSAALAAFIPKYEKFLYKMEHSNICKTGRNYLMFGSDQCTVRLQLLWVEFKWPFSVFLSFQESALLKLTEIWS